MVIENIKVGYFVSEYWDYVEVNGRICPYTVTVGVATYDDLIYDGKKFNGEYNGYGFNIYKTLEEALSEAKKLTEDVEIHKSLIGKEL